MRSHLREARRHPSTPKHSWLRELVDGGLMPRLVTLQTVTPKASPAVERRWVRRFARRYDLLNVAPAGSGNPGVGRVRWTPEVDQLLGCVPDSEIATMMSCERKTVAHRRQCLGIPASFDRKNNTPPPNMAGWNRKALPAEIESQLGKMPDYQLAAAAGVDKSVIARLRRKRGIPSFAASTGNDGRIRSGEPHRRWSHKGDTPPARPPKSLLGHAG